MKKYGKIFMNGIIDENPTFRMVLGMCPTLAITTAASNGIGMGLAVTFVLIFSNLVISLLRYIVLLLPIALLLVHLWPERAFLCFLLTELGACLVALPMYRSVYQSKIATL